MFGSLCFPHLVPYNSHKLMPKSCKCVFLGYDGSHKGYRCLDPLTGRVYVSRNVTFDESVFPFQCTNPTPPPNPTYRPLTLTHTQPQADTPPFIPPPSPPSPASHVPTPVDTPPIPSPALTGPTLILTPPSSLSPSPP